MSTTNEPVTDRENTYYRELNDVGKFKANFGLVIGLILGFVFIVIGIYMMIHDDSDKYLRIKGVIIETNCIKSSTTFDSDGYSINKYKCNIVTVYKIDGNVYAKKMYIVGSNNYSENEPIDLMVLKKDYGNVQIATIDGTTTGCIFVAIALLIMGLTYLNYYFTYKYIVFVASQETSAESRLDKY
jgi:hypothetical protein